ncbi:hypothetical protein ISS03_00340 [Patescibacteria group bacterium]|nr:hypothetical protein [Patescibacteria group bacterium]
MNSISSRAMLTVVIYLMVFFTAVYDVNARGVDLLEAYQNSIKARSELEEEGVIGEVWLESQNITFKEVQEAVYVSSFALWINDEEGVVIDDFLNKSLLVQPCLWNKLTQEQMNLLVLNEAVRHIGTKPDGLNCKTWSQRVVALASCHQAVIPLTYPDAYGWRLNSGTTIEELVDTDFTEVLPGTILQMHYFKLNGESIPHTAFVYSNTDKDICLIDNVRNRKSGEYEVYKRCYEHSHVKARTRGHISLYQVTNYKMQARRRPDDENRVATQ